MCIYKYIYIYTHKVSYTSSTTSQENRITANLMQLYRGGMCIILGVKKNPTLRFVDAQYSQTVTIAITWACALDDQ